MRRTGKHHFGHEDNCPPKLSNPRTLALNIVLAPAMLLGHGLLLLLGTPRDKREVRKAWGRFSRRSGLTDVSGPS